MDKLWGPNLTEDSSLFQLVFLLKLHMHIHLFSSLSQSAAFVQQTDDLASPTAIQYFKYFFKGDMNVPGRDWDTLAL